MSSKSDSTEIPFVLCLYSPRPSLLVNNVRGSIQVRSAAFFLFGKKCAVFKAAAVFKMGVFYGFRNVPLGTKWARSHFLVENSLSPAPIWAPINGWMISLQASKYAAFRHIIETTGNHFLMVGVRGFEPPTPASRTQYSTRLSYTPFLMLVKPL